MTEDQFNAAVRAYLVKNLTMQTDFIPGSSYGTPRIKVSLLLGGEVISQSEHGVYISGRDLS